MDDRAARTELLHAKLARTVVCPICGQTIPGIGDQHHYVDGTVRIMGVVDLFVTRATCKRPGE